VVLPPRQGAACPTWRRQTLPPSTLAARFHVSAGGAATTEKVVFFINLIHRWSFLPIHWGRWSLLPKFRRAAEFKKKMNNMHENICTVGQGLKQSEIFLTE
jgi:hypothetical protein